LARQKIYSTRKMTAPGQISTDYTSRPVPLPADFLGHATEQPIKATKIDFATSPLPEYANHYAIILENVLSPTECSELLRLAELSAGADAEPEAPDRSTSNNQLWRPALLSEDFVPDYRNSDRIIWDHAEVMRRLWERCLPAQVADGVTLRDELAVLHGRRSPGTIAVGASQRWRLSRLNERMRFLRYVPGHYFKRKST
jgi:hypothetical protein